MWNFRMILSFESKKILRIDSVTEWAYERGERGEAREVFFFFALLSLPRILVVVKTSISVYQNRR